ncbi:hypothetical protein [Desulfohalovibrio reitneri]|uniref:hypothetical protein n=1 Tax=Desulfohalovibrio reitneri TaxID=1307759 RepID=UPI0004A75A87|nr:hypothetical protein [Desulfohalovibrio reitneri]
MEWIRQPEARGIILFHILLALAAAIVFMGMSAMLFRARKAWMRSYRAALLLFVAALAGGVWLQPGGPPVWSVFWLPFLAAAALIWGLMVLFPTKERKEEEPGRGTEKLSKAKSPSVSGLIGAYFWFLLISRP